MPASIWGLGMCEHRTEASARRCLLLSEWPALDYAAWVAAHRRGGLLHEDGLAASWAPATSDIVAKGYGRFLSFLSETEGLDWAASPRERITRCRVEAFIVHLREQRNHSSTVAGRLLQLVRAAAVMAPSADWRWLRRIHARLRHMATPARDDRARLVPAITIRDLGFRLMQRAEAAGGLSARRRAVLFRNGLMICFLTACPIRARNVAALSIGTTLQRRGTQWWVAFGPGETKNKRPFEMPLPASFTEPIERYLIDYRPLLVRRSPSSKGGNAFWISDGGRPLTAKEIGQRVSAITKGELGRDLNPHLFRKLVPTELAIHDPEHVGIAQPLLGHADYQTTQRAYNLARAIDAARRHHAVVQEIRARGETASQLPEEAPNRPCDAIRSLRRSPSRRVS
jgi:integrase/recombinase XerD